MSFLTRCVLMPFKRSITLNGKLNFPRNTLAKVSSSVSTLGVKKKKLGGKAGPLVEKKIFSVNNDPEKLVNCCCGLNIYNACEDLKLGYEYPKWLWTIRTGPPPLFKELYPNSIKFWQKIRKRGVKRANQLLQLKKLN